MHTSLERPDSRAKTQDGMMDENRAIPREALEYVQGDNELLFNMYCDL